MPLHAPRNRYQRSRNKRSSRPTWTDVLYCHNNLDDVGGAPDNHDFINSLYTLGEHYSLTEQESNQLKFIVKDTCRRKDNLL